MNSPKSDKSNGYWRDKNSHYRSETPTDKRTTGRQLDDDLDNNSLFYDEDKDNDLRDMDGMHSNSDNEF
jgi:hypothetical protein